MQVKQTVVEGDRTPLDAFAVALAVTVSLMFVTLLLAAGLLALEREEQAFGRLVRGLVSRTALLTEKVVLSAAVRARRHAADAVRAGRLRRARLEPRARRGWPRWRAGRSASRRWAWRSAALAREVRVATLLAILLALPIVFLALVPSGSVAPALYDAINVVSALFPFKPALRALDGAINGGELLVPLVHLLALALAYGALARIALRRFA